MNCNIDDRNTHAAVVQRGAHAALTSAAAPDGHGARRVFDTFGTRILGSMSDIAPLEDERGVDRAAIQGLLRLSPQQRVERLIDVVATWTRMREAASPDRGGS